MPTRREEEAEDAKERGMKHEVKEKVAEQLKGSQRNEMSQKQEVCAHSICCKAPTKGGRKLWKNTQLYEQEYDREVLRECHGET